MTDIIVLSAQYNWNLILINSARVASIRVESRSIENFQAGSLLRDDILRFPYNFLAISR